MSGYKILFFIIGIILYGCESAFVDTLKKCSIHDSPCHKEVVQGVLKSIAKTGIPEFNIPGIDPFKVENASVMVLNMLKVNMPDGVVLGIKDCVVTNFETSIENEHAAMDLICDVTIKGQVEVYTDHEIVKNLLGMDKIDSKGEAKVKIDKLKLQIEYFFNIEERDGKSYIHCKFNNTIYKYDIGKMTFNTKGFIIGNTDMGPTFEILLNQYWSAAMSIVGINFMDKAMEYVYLYSHNFFDNAPTKLYLADDDLLKYVKN